MTGGVWPQLTRRRFPDRWPAALLAFLTALCLGFLATASTTYIGRGHQGSVQHRLTPASVLLGAAAMLALTSAVALLAKRQWGWLALGALCLAGLVACTVDANYLCAIFCLLWAWSCWEHYQSDTL